MGASKAGHQWGASTIRGEEYCKRPGCQVRRRHPPGSQLVWLYFLPGQQAKRHRIKCQAPLTRA